MQCRRYAGQSTVRFLVSVFTTAYSTALFEMHAQTLILLACLCIINMPIYKLDKRLSFNCSMISSFFKAGPRHFRWDTVVFHTFAGYTLRALQPQCSDYLSVLFILVHPHRLFTQLKGLLLYFHSTPSI